MSRASTDRRIRRDTRKMYAGVEQRLREREQNPEPAAPKHQPARWAKNAPAFTTWLRTQVAGWEGTQAKEAAKIREAIADGRGFDDPYVLQYAYLELRDDWKRLEAETFPDEWLEPGEQPRPVLRVVKPTAEQETMPELVGVAEVCSLLRLKRMQLKRLRDAGKFPEPMAELAAGPIWDRTEVDAWRNS